MPEIVRLHAVAIRQFFEIGAIAAAPLSTLDEVGIRIGFGRSTITHSSWIDQSTAPGERVRLTGIAPVGRTRPAKFGVVSDT